MQKTPKPVSCLPLHAKLYTSSCKEQTAETNDIKEKQLDEIILKSTLCTVAAASILYLPRHWQMV